MQRISQFEAKEERDSIITVKKLANVTRSRIVTLTPLDAATPEAGLGADKAITRVRLQRAVQHLFERFSPYLPRDPKNETPTFLQGPFGGPLPEYWISRADLELAPGVAASTQPIDATGSHGWNAVGLVWLHRRLLGVTIATPGGATLAIAPNAAGMKHIEGTTLTPHGAVAIAWSPQQPLLTIDLPERVRAYVSLPPELEVVRRSKALRYSSACTEEADARFLCTGRHLVFKRVNQPIAR